MSHAIWDVYSDLTYLWAAKIHHAHGATRRMTETTLRAQAYRALEEAIVTQSLRPGSKVTEVELSNRLGIGRTPIREALQRLAREGLVSVRPR
jgi:DNA-binding GntR family transcriptional regulator